MGSSGTKFVTQIWWGNGPSRHLGEALALSKIDVRSHGEISYRAVRNDPGMVLRSGLTEVNSHALGENSIGPRRPFFLGTARGGQRRTLDYLRRGTATIENSAKMAIIDS